MVHSGLPQVIRSKGFFWLASRMDWVGELSSVGGATQTSAAGFWFAARHRVDAQAVGQPLQTSITPLPYTDIGWQRQQTQCWTAPLPQPHEVGDASEYAAMQRLWHPLWGDRRQELAVIGVDMDAPRTRAVLDACLLSDQELRQGPAQWQLLDDPFPTGRGNGALRLRQAESTPSPASSSWRRCSLRSVATVSWLTPRPARALAVRVCFARNDEALNPQ